MAQVAINDCGHLRPGYWVPRGLQKRIKKRKVGGTKDKSQACFPHFLPDSKWEMPPKQEERVLLPTPSTPAKVSGSGCGEAQQHLSCFHASWQSFSPFSCPRHPLEKGRSILYICQGRLQGMPTIWNLERPSHEWGHNVNPPQKIGIPDRYLFVQGTLNN